MNLDYLYPASTIAPLVIHIEEVQSLDIDIDFTDTHIPSGYSSFVFNSSGKAEIIGNNALQLPPYFLVTPIFKSVKIRVSGRLDSFIVTCRTSVLSRLFGINVQRSREQYFTQLSTPIVEKIAAEIKANTNIKTREEIIETYLYKFTNLKGYQPDDIDFLYNSIIDSKGLSIMSDMYFKIVQSPQNIRKRFLKRIGINAKTLARIIRVNYLWDKIIKEKSIDFQDIVFEGNYFDQAHLIHDFKQIVGETPSYFFKRNQEHLSIISGKNHNSLQ